MAKQKQPTAKPTQPVAAPTVAATGRTPWYYAAVLAGIGAVLYLNTIGHGFVLDDDLVIKLNAYVQKGFGGIGQILTHSYRAGSSVSTDSEYMYRPLSVAMFAMEWSIAKDSPGIHHLMNVLWYALSGGMAFLLLRTMLGAERWVLALCAALLFVAHPLHTEVVANIKSRDEIMSLFFSMLALYYLFTADEGRKNAIPLALGAFFLALLAKEGAVTMVAIAPLALYFFGKNDAWKRGLLLVAPFLLWFMIRYAIMGKLDYTPNFNDNQLVAASLADRWATGLVVLLKYLQILVVPVGLAWDYSFNAIATTNWGNPLAMASLALHTGLAVFGLWGMRTRNPLAFCALAYLGSMALYSNLPLLIGTMMGERLAYVASLWFCLAAVLLLARLLRFEGNSNLDALLSGKNATALLGVVGAVALVFGGLTFMRNPIWKNNYTLVTSNAKETAKSFRALQAIGEESLLKYASKDTPPADTAALLAQAQQGFVQSYALRPTFNNTLGMGNVAYFRKQYTTAIKHFEESYQLQPGKLAKDRLLVVYRDLGRIEGQQKNNLPAAIQYFEKAMQYDSTDAQLLIDLGTAHAISQRPERAVPYFEKAIQRVPQDMTLRRNLAIAYRQLGMLDKAAALER